LRSSYGISNETDSVRPLCDDGQAVIAGSRITVELLLEKLAAGETVDQILDAHPRLTRGGIQAVLER
jgi:uncharacterized protein (DUF433 family)